MITKHVENVVIENEVIVLQAKSADKVIDVSQGDR